jgi:uncharacterized protein YggE
MERPCKPYNDGENRMRTYKVTFEIVLKSDDTDWIEKVIDEQLESGEEIIDGNIEEIKK